MKENTVQIANQLKHLCNVDISKYDESFLDKSIRKRVEQTQFQSIEEYCSFLEQNKEEIEVFSNSLHNNYSKFFRNTFTFSVLEHIVLPTLVKNKKGNKKKEIRIWSSACAAGQEAYSLSILLEELKNRVKGKFNYRIFATDQCDSQIKKAAKGQYAEKDIDNLSLNHVNQWFTKRGDIYTVKQALKKNIYFSVFDLFDENLNSPPTSIFGYFDLIICANLLFYYNREHQKKILKKVNNNLAKKGYVITGEAEREILRRYNYIEVFPPSAIFRIP